MAGSLDLWGTFIKDVRRFWAISDIPTYPCPMFSTVLNYTVSKGHLWRHEVKVHKLRPYKCTLCLETFVRKCELLDHCGTYHEGEKMPVGSNKLQFKCTVCAVSFLSNDLLLVHKANHGDLRRDGKLKVKPGKKFWCAICELNFLSKDLLCEHKATAAHDLTKRLKNNTFKCRLCDMGFASKENIRRHEIKQHKLEPYKCTLCTDTFARKCELVEHCADYHQGEKMPVKSKKIPHRSQFYIQLVYKPHLKT